MKYSIDSYRAILERALASGYSFVPFNLDVADQAGRIYLRHDVDYSLELALQLATVNAKAGVQGTFCVLLRSHIYNLLCPRSREIITHIDALGQPVALHFALPAIPSTADDGLAASVRADFEIARSSLPMLSPVFSWHNPTPDLLERTASHGEIAGLINAYAARFTRDITYLSDSNMRHAVDDFLAILRSRHHAALQLLFHPLNWVVGGKTMADVLSGTWKHVIVERERDFLTNRSYAELLPAGMPASVLDTFAKQWRCAAGSAGED